MELSDFLVAQCAPINKYSCILLNTVLLKKFFFFFQWRMIFNYFETFAVHITMNFMDICKADYRCKALNQIGSNKKTSQVSICGSL